MSQSKAEKKAGAEFIRRHKIGTLVSQLCTVLPKSLICKNSRQPDILRAAIKYIKECQECQLPSLEDERERKYALKINSLENYIKDLETRCQRYAHLLDINGICKISWQSENSNNVTTHENTTVPETDESKDEQEDVEFSDATECNVEDNVENSGTTPNLSTPVILLVDQRVSASGRPKRPRSGFPSALKLPKLRPKPDDSAIDIGQCSEASAAAECPIINDGLESVEQPLSDSSITSIGENDDRGQDAIIVNIDQAESPVAVTNPITTTSLEKVEVVAVGTDAVVVTTSEIEVQTDFETFESELKFIDRTTVSSSESKFVDRAISPCIFEEDRSKQVKKTIRKCNPDAIAEIVSFVATNVNPITVLTDKADEANKSTTNNALCPPAMLRVEDILHQPVTPAGNPVPAAVNRTASTGAKSNKRSNSSKQSSAKRAAPDKADRNYATSSSSSSWREYLPNFSQGYSHASNSTSNGPPTATVAKQALEPSTVSSSNKRTNAKSNAAPPPPQPPPPNALGRQQTADFSIDSLSGDIASVKNRSNATTGSSHKASTAAASKLTHFPCSTANSNPLPPPSNSSAVPTGMPMYSEMSMFLPFHGAPPPPPPPSFLEPKGKMKQQQQQQRSELSHAPAGGAMFAMNAVNNPLIPTDGSQEVNLNNSIFDLQGSTNMGGPLVQPYNAGQPVNFYNFSATPKIASNTAAKERASELNSLGWQCSTDHGGFVAATAAHPYAQSLEALQSAGQKVQNFQIASMFPESTTTSLANARTLQQQAATYRWNDTRFPAEPPTANSSMSSSLPAQQYSSGQDPANTWLPQVFPYTNHERSSTNNFMPSFNFSQPNNHT